MGRKGKAAALALMALLALLAPGGLLASRRGSAEPLAAAPELGTTILVLRARPGSYELVSSVARPALPPRASAGSARFTVEDAETGSFVGTGAFEAPPLCARGEADHVEGCTMIRHEAVIRLKVPHRAPRERVRLMDERGLEVASFLVEAKP